MMAGQHLSRGSRGPDLENLLFQATMPGLDEEIMFRGLLLGLLNGVFGKPWTVCGARFGWGLVITTLWFGSIHGVFWQAGSGLTINLLPILEIGGIGLVFAWIRERSGSVIPAILAHNFCDVMVALV